MSWGFRYEEDEQCVWYDSSSGVNKLLQTLEVGKSMDAGIELMPQACTTSFRPHLFTPPSTLLITQLGDLAVLSHRSQAQCVERNKVLTCFEKLAVNESAQCVPLFSLAPFLYEAENRCNISNICIHITTRGARHFTTMLQESIIRAISALSIILKA